ncbi:MAG TPA: YMGG-like glycine zipper-containing protein [Pyrinomonadaceae bacterium]|nr:YMGG-like glycine zipper-containing protein [Pyrinomonadaceae bacterium]
MIDRMRQITALALVVLLASVSISAQTRRPYGGTNAATRQLIRSIEDRTDVFRNSLDSTLDRSRYDGTRAEDDINRFVRDFQDSVRDFRQRYNANNSTASDAQVVIDRASVIDDFMARNRGYLNIRVQNDWIALRRDLNELARAYGIPGVRATRAIISTPVGSVDVGQVGVGVGATNRLTGTYQLDAQRSDDPQQAADNATRGLPYNQRRAVRDRLTAMLESPDRLAIERRGLQVTLASSRSPQITFTADGRETVVQTPSGRSVRSSARLVGDQLSVSSTGDRNNDFSVTFDPIEGGQRLRVTRNVYTEGIGRQVTLVSMYNKLSPVADFNGVYTGPQVGGGVGAGTASNDYIVPDGTTVIGTLNENLSTVRARDGDQFTLTVTQPYDYQGALITGHLSGVQRSGTLTGRSQMTMNYDTIRLRNGSQYRFAGITETIRVPNDSSVRVDTEGTVQDQNQTTRTEQRAAIGGVAGAVLGAIIGGGRGAAIGAIVGAGGGAGSVYVQGRNDLELNSGTEVTVRASSPNR